MKGKLAAATLRSIALNWIERKGPRPPKALVIQDLHILGFHLRDETAMLLYMSLKFCIKIESNSKDFFRFCPVHQHGRSDAVVDFVLA